MKSVQKFKTTGRFNSALKKQDKRTAKTAAINSNLGIDTDLIGAIRFSQKKQTMDKIFVSITRRYEHTPYANEDASAKQ